MTHRLTTPGLMACTRYPDLFSTPDGHRVSTSTYQARLDAAREICIECPIMLACRDEARQLRAFGVWGGEDDIERASAGFKPRQRRQPAQCGTEAGARRHRLAQEKPCTICLQAETGAQRLRKRRAEPPKCGTRRGYQRHRRLGEDA
ncbi:WhiB family transcriptional regulator [Kitasatospora saccharophila]